MAGSDVQRVADWIYDRLAGDATLTNLGLTGVYDTDAPASAVYPFLRIFESGNSTTRGNGGLRVLANTVFGIEVILQGRSYEYIRPMAERADALLDGVEDETALLTVVSVNRDSEIKRGYTEDGLDYRHLGGFYRVIARAS